LNSDRPIIVKLALAVPGQAVLGWIYGTVGTRQRNLVGSMNGQRGENDDGKRRETSEYKRGEWRD